MRITLGTLHSSGIVLIKTQQVVRGGAVIIHILLQTLHYVRSWKPVLLHLLHDVFIYIILTTVTYQY